MGFSTEWTRHLPEKDKKDFEDTVRHSTQVLGRLRDILRNRVTAIENAETKRDMYGAGYPYDQAHLNGKRAALKEAMKLLDFLND